MSLPDLLRRDHRRARRGVWETFVQELRFDGEAVGWAVGLELVVWVDVRAAALY